MSLHPITLSLKQESDVFMRIEERDSEYMIGERLDEEFEDERVSDDVE